jgi:release factor glutamine methyltransferase
LKATGRKKNMKFLSQEQIEKIETGQTLLQNQWKSRKPDGEIVNYLGKEFIVLRNVFPPRNDSKGIVENFPDLTGKSILDVGTGSGVISIFAALHRAENVLAIDITRV